MKKHHGHPITRLIVTRSRMVMCKKQRPKSSGLFPVYCKNKVETVEHFLLGCTQFPNQIKLLTQEVQHEETQSQNLNCNCLSSKRRNSILLNVGGGSEEITRSYSSSYEQFTRKTRIYKICKETQCKLHASDLSAHTVFYVHVLQNVHIKCAHVMHKGA